MCMCANSLLEVCDIRVHMLSGDALGNVCRWRVEHYPLQNKINFTSLAKPRQLETTSKTHSITVIIRSYIRMLISLVLGRILNQCHSFKKEGRNSIQGLQLVVPVSLSACSSLLKAAGEDITSPKSFGHQKWKKSWLVCQREEGDPNKV